MDSRYVLQLFTVGVSPFGNLRIEAYLQLPAAYRSLSRPSSAPDAKAFTLRSYSLELLSFNIWFSILNCLSFFLNISFRDYIVRIEKVSLSFVHFFHLSVKLFFYPLLLERPIISYLSSISVRFYSNLHIQNVCDLSLIRLSKIIAKPAGSAGRSGWTRTIDLTLIRRAL